MKEYFKRLITTPRKFELALWWILRVLLIYAFIKGFFPPEGKAFDITDPLQVGANFLCTFVWEIFQMLPKKNSLRHVSPSVQSFLVIGIFAASFGGKFMNLYYDSPYLDVVMHFIGGGACVFFGYEIVAAMQKKDKAAVPLSIVLLCAMGFSFLASTGWELFEFTFDQISCAQHAAQSGGVLTPEIAKTVGDAQHWCMMKAMDTPKGSFQLIKPMFEERWPLMDTMTDMVLNTLGALIAVIAIRVFPYRHKGKNNLNELYKAEKKNED